MSTDTRSEVGIDLYARGMSDPTENQRPDDFRAAQDTEYTPESVPHDPDDLPVVDDGDDTLVVDDERPVPLDEPDIDAV